MKIVLSTILSALLLQSLSAFDQTHTAWEKLVSTYVKEDGVDYKDFKTEQSELKTYLKDLASVSREDFNTWAGNEQLAFLINLYNASTIDLVLDNYPIKSFKDEVGGKDGPWKLSFIKAIGKTFTLDEVEHELIRKNFNEPRIHFAVNCASAGCPPLRSEAFTGDKLLDQLEESSKTFLANSAVNSFDGKTLTLSPIFDWFQEDFIKKSGSVEAFVAPYYDNKAIQKGKVTLKYSDYGWTLNAAS